MSNAEPKIGNIAFLFLTYGDLTFNDVMEKYVENRPVYIHPKYEVKHPFFSKCVIDKHIETKWGDMSIVDATLALLEAAIKRRETEWFILLSEDIYPMRSVVELDQFLELSPKQSMFYQDSPEPFVGKNGQVWKSHQWWILHRTDVEWLTNSITKQMTDHIRSLISGVENAVGAYDELFFLTAFKTYIPNYSFISFRPTYAKFLQNVIIRNPITWNRLTFKDQINIKEAKSFFIRKVSKFFISKPIVVQDELRVVFIGSKTNQHKLLSLIDNETSDIVIFAGIPLDNIHPGLIEKSIYICPIIWKFVYQSFASLSAELESSTNWSRILFIDEQFDYEKLSNPESSEKVALPGVEDSRKIYRRITDGRNNAWTLTRYFSEDKFKVGFIFIVEKQLDTVWIEYITQSNYGVGIVCGQQVALPQQSAKIRSFVKVNVDEGASFFEKIQKSISHGLKLNGGALHKFLILTDSCRPLRPFAEFYEMLKSTDIDATFADYRDIFKYEKYPHNYVKHSPFVCFSRKSARIIQSLKVSAAATISDANSNRNFLSYIPANHTIWGEIHNVPIVHENWNSTYAKVDAIDIQMQNLYKRLHQFPEDRDIQNKLAELREEKVIIRESPEIYGANGANTAEHNLAMDSGAFFWSGFIPGAKLQPIVPAIKKVRRELQFIHITKTAGTAVEELGIQNGIFWGRHDDSFRRLTYKLPNRGLEPWHVPTTFFHKNELIKVMKDRDLFTVIRNPYDRVISEYFCKWGGPKEQSAQVSEMNKWIETKLKMVLNATETSSFQSNHWVPQYLYLVNDGKQVMPTENIVLFEHLNEELNSLFKRYGYDLNAESMTPQNVGQKKMGVADLSAENRSLIEQVYMQDILLHKSLTEARYPKSKSPEYRPKSTSPEYRPKSTSPEYRPKSTSPEYHPESTSPAYMPSSKASSVELTPINLSVPSSRSKSKDSIELTPIDELIARLQFVISKSPPSATRKKSKTPSPKKTPEKPDSATRKKTKTPEPPAAIKPKSPVKPTVFPESSASRTRKSPPKKTAATKKKSPEDKPAARRPRCPIGSRWNGVECVPNKK